MPVFDRFVAARREAVPAAYLLPERFGELATLLRRQGIGVERLRAGWEGPAESFAVESLTVGPLFEGHRTVMLEGRWSASHLAEAGPGWYLVRTDQRLGILAAYLLEPASEDGIVTWNFLDRELAAGQDFPILRTGAAVGVPAEALP
jgi:hypothetical protein